MHIELKYFMKTKQSVLILGYVLSLAALLILAKNLNFLIYSSHPSSLAAPKLITLPSAASIHPTIEFKGSLIARSKQTTITELVFTIAGANNTKPLKLTPDTLTISYHDQFQAENHLAWSKRFQGDHNQDDLLDPGELVQLTVPLSNVLARQLGSNTAFVIEVTPTHSATLSIQGTTPAEFEPIMELNEQP